MHKMAVLVKAVDGRTEELARWYDQTHLPDLLAVSGITSVERHSLMPVKRPEGTTEWDFLMLYEMEGDDPMLVLMNMAKAQVPIQCDALDSTQTLSLIAKSEVRLVK